MSRDDWTLAFTAASEHMTLMKQNMEWWGSKSQLKCVFSVWWWNRAEFKYCWSAIHTWCFQALVLTLVTWSLSMTMAFVLQGYSRRVLIKSYTYRKKPGLNTLLSNCKLIRTIRPFHIICNLPVSLLLIVDWHVNIAYQRGVYIFILSWEELSVF